MSKTMKPIDLRKLAQNFQNEKFKDERYWQRNDAKFRAVHQRCATYDEFRQIVEAAHLRPLDKNEKLTLERRPIAWNQTATNTSATIPTYSYINHKPETTYNDQTQFFLPKNVTEFIQQWRRLSNKNRLDYLRQINNFETLFLSDIPTDFLHDLTLLYNSNSSSNDADIIVQILIDLIKSKRFDLIKTFLTNKDKIELDRLFSCLCSFVHLRSVIFLLKYLYLEI